MWPAVLAGAPKDDVMRSHCIAAPVCDALDRRLEGGILERLDLAAVVADQVMMVVAAGMCGLEARNAVTEVDTLDESEPVEPLERAIDARNADAWTRGEEALVDLLG